MGVVYKAYDPMIGRLVAVKTMRLTEEGTGMPKPELVQRFQNETRAAGLLSHSNIVTIFDAGEDAGLFYITMEYVEGRSLLAYMDERRAFPLPRTLRVMEQACAALEYAHQRSVVHRDVKPANMLLGPGDTLKITDFGTAKILQLSTTQTGNIIGTPSYMSPEQVKGKPIDGRSDVFSLGVILYELVTGEKPFPGQNVTTVIYKIVNEEPIPPREIDSSVHPGLNSVISKALAKDVNDRFHSCADLLDALKNYRKVEVAAPPANATVFMASPSVGAPQKPEPEPAPVPPVKEPSAPPRAAPTPPAPPPPPRPDPQAAPRPAARPVQLHVPEPEPRRGGMILLVLVLLGVLGAGGYFIWPTIQELMGNKDLQQAIRPSGQPAAPTGGETAAVEPGTPGKSAPQPAPAAKEPEAAAKAPPEEPPASPAATAQPDPAEWDSVQKRIEQRIAQAGFAERVRVERRGDGFELAGTLTAGERRQLLQRLRGAAGRFRMDDRIRLARAEPAAAKPEPAEREGSEKPQTAPGMGEIEVITNIAGATVTLLAPDGRTVGTRPTPTRFEDLPPGRYTMEIVKAGFRTERRIVNVRADRIEEEELTLEPTASGLVLSSRPPGSSIFINGQRRTETTPATIMLAPGRYTIGVVAEGFQRYETSLQLTENLLHEMNVELQRLPGQGVGYIDVRTIPPGADILLNETNTGLKTPYRLELPAGDYTLVLFRRGYVTIRKSVTLREGQTVTINERMTSSP